MKHILTIDKPQSKSTVVIFAFNVGSANDTIGGEAHLLEHMLFEGSKKYTTALKLASTIDNVGGEFNAATTKTHTFFYIKVASQFSELALDVLSDMMLHPLFARFSKEKKVVLNEITQSLDEPKQNTWQTFEQELFEGPFAKPIAGTIESVKQIQLKDIIQRYYTQYGKENCIICLGGKISEKLKRKAKTIFDQLPSVLIKHPTAIKKKPTLCCKKIHSDTTYICHGIAAPNSNNPQAFAFDVIESILSKGQSGLLFDALRNKNGVSYDVKSLYYAQAQGSTMSIQLSCDKKDKQIALVQIKKCIKQIQQITPTQLAQAKKYIVGQYLLSMEDILEQSLTYIQNEFEKIPAYIPAINKVTCEQVKQCAKQLEHATTVICEPK
jgi:predicted Zn-dependent peptidase